MRQQIFRKGRIGKKYSAKPIHISPKKPWIILLTTVAIIAIVAGIWGVSLVIDPSSKKIREVQKAVDFAEQSRISMTTINNQFTVIQNGKKNNNINQGVLLKDEEADQMGIVADMSFTSALNPSNNYSLSLDVWKKADQILEKQGARYEKTDLSIDEFKKAVKEYRIYRFTASNTKTIESVQSLDKTSTIYQITLKSLGDSLVEQYLTSISKQVGEKFNTNDIQSTNAMIIANITNGVLKSQQLKFQMTVKSNTNEIEISNVSEININLDADIIHQNLAGRYEK